jgi:AmiR/NasT family two-component response regulator
VLTNRIVVEQAKGFLRQRLNISVDDAFSLLRRYAHTHGEHLTEVARQLMSEPGARPALMQKMKQLAYE